MITQILILTESPFSKRDYDRFGVKLLSQSFRVSILDCTAWLKPDVWDKFSGIAYRCPYRCACHYAMAPIAYFGADNPGIDPAVCDEIIGAYVKSVRIWDYVTNNYPRTYPDGQEVEVIALEAPATA